MSNQELLQRVCQEQGFSLSDMALTQFEQMKSLLQEWNEKMNLTAITDEEGIYRKHYADCLSALHLLEPQVTCLDVGSGAGFPGLVFAVARPDVHMTLLEPLGKRCTYLHEVVNQLQLQNVTIINARAEEYIQHARETFDVVTARAVAALPILSELCIPFVKVGGLFLALKGSSGQQEVHASLNALQTLGANFEHLEEVDLEQDGIHTLVCVRKTHPTNLKYPRNYGQIKKKPLA